MRRRICSSRLPLQKSRGDELAKFIALKREMEFLSARLSTVGIAYTAQPIEEYAEWSVL